MRRAEMLLAAACGVAGYILASALVTVSVRAAWWREARRQKPDLTDPGPAEGPRLVVRRHRVSKPCTMCSGTGRVDCG